MLLIALGAMELFVASQFVLDPVEARCRAARFQVESALDDDEEFNDPDMPEGVDEADDLDCDDAIRLAGAIPEDEDDEPDGTFPDSGTFRTQGIIITTVGLGHAVTGFLTLRTRQRWARVAALVFAAVGLLFPVLGLISLVVLAFAVFALAFSADAKAIFGPGSGFFRPRVPRGG
jgi:hypothetical protein